MASYPGSDNSWVFASSEVGRAGLGAPWKRGSCRPGLPSGCVPFLGPDGHLNHLMLAAGEPQGLEEGD